MHKIVNNSKYFKNVYTFKNNSQYQTKCIFFRLGEVSVTLFPNTNALNCFYN